jgi:4-aminobutyrate aminotransferase
MSDYPRMVVTPPGPKTRAFYGGEGIANALRNPRVYPLVVDSAQDCIIRDLDGNEYIDFTSGLGVMNVGHRHARVIEAMKRMMRTLLHVPDLYRHVARDQLSEALVQIAPGKGRKTVFYSNSGAEAVETAIKLAAWHTRSRHFIAFMGASHGMTTGAHSLSSLAASQRRYLPTTLSVSHVPSPYCYRCAWGQTDQECDLQCSDYISEHLLKHCISREEVAALVFEPIQVEAGCVIPPSAFFKSIVRVAKRQGLLLIVDESWTGMGRTGRWFASQHFSVDPDILCVDGSLSSGLPLGSTIANAEVADWDPGSHRSVLGGNPVACAAASEVIAIVRDGHLLENAARQGNYAVRRLTEMMADHAIIGDVRGLGLLLGIELVKDRKTRQPALHEAEEVMWKLWKRGITTTIVGASTLLFSPPLTIDRPLLDSGLTVFEGVLRAYEAENA